MLQDHIEVIEPAFGSLVLGNTRLEHLWTGAYWAEGPAWFGGGRYLIFSDIPNDRMMRFDETDGAMSVFRSPSRHANGNTRDREGRLVTCEHLGRQITRTEHDGRIIVLADRYDGKRFNSPNDIVVSSDGAIWFTDPTYGIDKEYEGRKAESEIGGSYVYRIDPHTGRVAIVADDFVKPNGLAFSADEKILYIADTGASHVENGPRHIRRFDVDGARLSGGEVFAECTVGLFDGFRVDVTDNIWSSAGDGVHCYDKGGTLIGKIKVPEVVANVCFGGTYRNRLYICATNSLYRTWVHTRGCAYPGDPVWDYGL